MNSFSFRQSCFLCIRMKKALLFLLLFSCFSAGAQIGGSAVHSFLNIPASARVAAMGGTFISVKDNDLNLAMQAPSLLNPSMHRNLALSAVSYVDGVKFADAAYAHHKGALGTFMAGIHSAQYGSFTETNEFGDIQGSFRAADYALVLGWSKPLNELFSVGASLKPVYSDYYIYNSFALAADLSATYFDTTHQFTVTVMARNAGVQLKNYVKDNNEPLPAEILLGLSKRLSHTPLRFNLTVRNLQKFNLKYDDPLNLGDVDPVTGRAEQKEIGFFDNLTRHFILGAEVLLSKNFHLRAAYNFQRRKELLLDTRTALTGFSFGVGMKVSKFHISYGRANYHLAGGADHISITTNFSEMTRKK